MRAARVRSVCDECITLPGREPLEDANSLGHPDSHELSGDDGYEALALHRQGGEHTVLRRLVGTALRVAPVLACTGSCDTERARPAGSATTPPLLAAQSDTLLREGGRPVALVA